MAIRKYTQIVNKIGPSADVKGIRILPSASAFERTICGCGFADASQVYECPVCGNTEFVVVDYRDKEIRTMEPAIHISGNNVKITKETHYVMLRHEVELDKREEVLFEYDGVNCSFNRWNYTNEAFKLFRENQDKLPADMQYAITVMDACELEDTRTFAHLLSAHPRLDYFIQNEIKDHPAFVKALVRSKFSGYSSNSDDIDFRSMEEYYRVYNIPVEFRELVDRFPSDFYSRTISLKYGWRANPNAKFQKPENWDNVPDEIKGICKYYLENGAINLGTYFSLGNVNHLILKNKKVFSRFLKKYMMAYKDRIVHEINHACDYLTSEGIEINETTFDSKWICQRKNASELYKNLSRAEADIDNFINNCETDAVNAIKMLANAKRTKRAKTEE